MKRQHDDLQARVATRKSQLISEIIEHKKNSSRFGAAEAIGKIKDHLLELSQILKANEFTQLDADARVRLADWIAR
jgi:hypothetical protein